MSQRTRPRTVQQIRSWHLDPQRRLSRTHLGATLAAAVLAATSLAAASVAHADTHLKGCRGPVHKHITTHHVSGGILYATADPIHPIDSRKGRAAFMTAYTYCPDEQEEGRKKLRSVRGCITWDNALLTTDAPHSAFYRGLRWRFTVRNDPPSAANRWRLPIQWYMPGKMQTQQCTHWHTVSADDVPWVRNSAHMEFSASTSAYHKPAVYDSGQGIKSPGYWELHPSTDHRIW